MYVRNETMIPNSIYTNILILKKVSLLTLFLIFIQPFSLSIDGQGVSANYLFVLFPLFVLLIKGRVYKPEMGVFILMLLLFIIFIVTLGQDNHLLRRTASFLVFMSMFALFFVKIDSDMFQYFKVAVILFSLFTIIDTINHFFENGGNEMGTYAKGVVGTQRIGFVYIMAFWIVLLYKPRGNLFIVVKHAAVCIIFCGIFLTFSRTSIFAFTISLGVYSFIAIIFHIKNYKSFRYILHRLFLSIIYSLILLTVLSSFFQVTIDQYENTIFRYMFKSVPLHHDQSIDKETILMKKFLDWEGLDNNKKLDDPRNFDNSSNGPAIQRNIVLRDTQNKNTPVPRNFDNSSNGSAIQRNIVLRDTQNKNTPVPRNFDNSSNGSSIQRNIVLRDIQNKNTSVGYRIFISDKVLDYVVKNPLTGSGFIGVWTLFENKEGSAHSQYLDVFFRVGFLGFIFYVFILYKISSFLYKKDTGLFIGFMGILAYGLFHETFKLSQGGFIFAFLLAFYYQNRHILKKNI